MDAARAGRARGIVYRLDQGAAQPALARALSHEQILQIAVVADRPAGAVIDVVHDAEKLAVDVAAEQPHRLVRIVQPRPGRALVQAQRADRNLRGHGNAAISAWMRSSCGMVSAGRRPKPHSVAIENSLSTSPKIAIIRSISCRVTVSAGMKRSVSVRGALIKSPRC